jgi:hypothetical protein
MTTPSLFPAITASATSDRLPSCGSPGESLFWLHSPLATTKHETGGRSPVDTPDHRTPAEPLRGGVARGVNQLRNRTSSAGIGFDLAQGQGPDPL